MKVVKPMIKILHFVGEPTDAELISWILNKADINFDLRVVINRQDYISALTEFQPEIIISDHSLPSCNSMEALDILKNLKLNIPFILVTQAVSVEFTVLAMKKGVNDYILKDRLQRLPAAILCALEQFKLERHEKETAQKIEERDRQYNNLLQNLPVALYTCDADGKILFFNKAVAELWRREPSIEKELWCGSYKAYDADNNLIAPERSPMFHAIKQGVNLGGIEIIFERPDGTKRHVIAHSRPNFDTKGEVTGGVNVLIDITIRKVVELEKTKVVNDLYKRSKNLEQFAYIVSHNLRSPIANIQGISNVLQGNISNEDREETQKFLFSAVNQLDETIKDLHGILQSQAEITENKKEVFFEDLITDVKSGIQDIIKKENVVILTDFSAINKILSLKSYLHSIFTNLIGNSIKYRQYNRSPIIRIKTEIDKGKVRISFKDNGTGLDLKQHGKNLFQLYKRFHLNTEGKGLGLFMVKTQVEALKGRISVKSELNIGTEFIIELPL